MENAERKPKQKLREIRPRTSAMKSVTGGDADPEQVKEKPKRKKFIGRRAQIAIDEAKKKKTGAGADPEHDKGKPPPEEPPKRTKMV